MVIENYKENILKELKSRFGIIADKSALDSILSPNEFRQLIFRYTPQDFSVGDSKSADFKDFFKNVTEGKFRVTLHTHTDFSDGRMDPESFIDQAAMYADKVAKIMPKDDTQPPFMIALTDHDEIVGCQEIIKIIAQNPERYKNLKFVVGSEIGVSIGNNYFDLTALGFNPFDEKLNEFIINLKDKRTETIREFIQKINKLYGSDYTLEDLAKIGFKGKKTLQNRSGLIYVEDSKNILRKLFTDKYGQGNNYGEQIQKIYEENNYAYRDIPDVETVINLIKEAGGLASWTHPVRSFSKMNDLTWHESFLKELKKLGVDGVEANHQYTYGQYNAIKFIDEKNALYRDLAKKYNMFLSGGTDAHEENIFAHHQPIEDDLLNGFLN